MDLARNIFISVVLCATVLFSQSSVNSSTLDGFNIFQSENYQTANSGNRLSYVNLYYRDILAERVVPEYHADGRLNSILHQFIQQIDTMQIYSNYFKIEYSYNALNLPDTITSSQNGTEWTIMEQEVIEYNTLKQPVNVRTFMKQEAGLVETLSETSEFDQEGNATQRIIQYNDNGTWRNNRREINYYSAHGLDSGLTQVWRDGDWANWQKSVYQYNDGKMTHGSGMEFVDGEWIERVKTKITYNNSNTADTTITDLMGTEGWVSYLRKIRTYNDNGNPENTTFWLKNNDEWTLYTDYILLELPEFSRLLVRGSEIKYYYENASSLNDDVSGILTFTLEQNYPNPFNPSTVIAFTILEPSDVKIDIFASDGSKITTLTEGRYQVGNYSVPFQSDNLASGVYFYQLKTNHGSVAKKMILVK